MERECPSVTTHSRSSPQNQLTYRTVQSTPPTEAHIAQKNPTATTPARPRPQHQITDRNANITPLSEAHITQKNTSRPMCGGSRHPAPYPYPHPSHQNETRAWALGPEATPDPAITTQLQPQSSHRNLTEHRTNHPARPSPQHQLNNRNANVTPLSEAHTTHKIKSRPTREGGRWPVQHPYPNHPDETHTHRRLVKK